MENFALILDARNLHHPSELQLLLQPILAQIPSSLHRSLIIITPHPVTAFPPLPPEWLIIPIEDLKTSLNRYNYRCLGYIPLIPESLPTLLPLPTIYSDSPAFIAPWIPQTNFPLETAQAAAFNLSTWIASIELVQSSLTQQCPDYPWLLPKLAESLEKQSKNFRWQAISSSEPPVIPKLTPKVLAVIPHYGCEAWLHRCLLSLVNQTRPPDNIVVIDDNSPTTPTEIVAKFPTVTLMVAQENVGPYRLVQQIIKETAYDYYLFQDADDWSASQRLARLLSMAETQKADLVGTQEIRLDATTQTLTSITYPLDVNQALVEKPGHPLLHSTSLVRRSLVMQLGGFATGLRFGGDTEFLLRAAFVGRIVNIPEYGYFRQKRPHSLTTAPQTGLNSPARKQLLATLKQRANENRIAIAQGKKPNLEPLATSTPITLNHCFGPALNT
ncbi:MAG: glycosyltransferase family A protein [Jaaginema sp. PMC 1079.18]|nr:glycosyltransferase family A protein [Jaaginema sp. PMC 1080.18]MEC4849755.1 glycosyltransferase family A protein [Jaaginema sp. PMC 1079.18]MEC4866619.1 glycosyltransferase family A protein [Jaaginema sp. PMC 1078.18]